MSLKISGLKRKWNQEKDYYQKQEVGTGVQSFVKDILSSDDLFSLKEGKLSTNNQDRRNEFIHEKNAKEKRRADFYIYINPEIAIPIEVECYKNIQVGEKQLFNYQKDFDKHYGILTDGFTWRFYNNNVYRIFTLRDMLDKTQLFITFWKEYIKPEFYYLSFFEKVGQLALLKETKLHVDNNRQLFFEDITKLIEGFKNKLKIEGYLESSDNKLSEKKAIELTYAYIIQFILYKTLVDNEFDDFATEFESFVEKIHQFLKQKRYKDILGIIEGISANISKNIYRPFTKEQAFIKDKIQELYHRVENSLSDVSPWLDIFIFIKKYNFANVRNEIFGYIYENYLKELYEESKKGQYFTDPAIVNFMLEQVGYTPDSLIKRLDHDPDGDYISIIDPSCGSGTFLYSATDQILNAVPNGSEDTSRKIEELINNNVFGLDIEEFPLYLAEMNILMRMLPLIINEKYNNPIDKKIKVFWTKDSIAEFIDAGLKNTINDIDVIGGQQVLFDSRKLDFEFESYMREKSDLADMKQSMRPSRRRFDYVIGNPPYISYNECSKQGILIFSLMKQGKVKLSDVYGLNLHSVSERQKRYSPKPNFYAFFIALGLALLKDNGKLCFIIPQTVLTSGDLDVIRYHLARFTTIEKIITFSGKMFLGRGLKQNKPIATSSLILIVSKNRPRDLQEVEIWNHLGSGENIEETFRKIARKEKTTKNKILQSQLLQNLANWNFIQQNKEYLDFHIEYKRKSEEISIYYNHVLARHNFNSRFYFDIGFVLNPKYITTINNSEESYELLDFKSFYNYSSFIPKAFYPKDRNKIKLTQNNQGYITLDQQYKIVWSVKNPDKFYFTDHHIIFYMGKASIICSDNREEIFYLLSLLNSPINKLILKNLQNEQEKEFLIPIKAIKEFVRIPKITDQNQHIKEETIRLTGGLLKLERILLSDFVDFSKIMVQKFDKVSVEVNKLILEKDMESIELPIKKDFTLVKKVIEAKYGQDGLELENKTIMLSDLISFPVIDFEKQKEIKDLIDDLVFCLYFNVGVPKDKVSNADFVKSLCQKNKFYAQVKNI
ncbi:SAM-dependent DNA methyltransferase [Candidatus Daviesbacteria bacterium]|nr:SAM-dependent DNA methyltransferase [Candidatus Daviesbacteria bacterium]